MLEINYKLTLERETLSRLYCGFKRHARPRPRFVDDVELQGAVAPNKPPGARLFGPDPDAVMVRAIAALSEAVEAMVPQERLLLKLRFVEGMAVADIARLLRAEQKPLYRQFDLRMTGEKTEGGDGVTVISLA